VNPCNVCTFPKHLCNRRNVGIQGRRRQTHQASEYVLDSLIERAKSNHLIPPVDQEIASFEPIRPFHDAFPKKPILLILRLRVVQIQAPVLDVARYRGNSATRLTYLLRNGLRSSFAKYA